MCDILIACYIFSVITRFLMLLAAAMLPIALMLHLALASISEKLLKEWIGPKGLQYLKISVVSLDRI